MIIIKIIILYFIQIRHTDDFPSTGIPASDINSLIINNTPHIVKDKVNTHSFQGFSLYVKQYLIRKYNTNCITRNCYICEQNA